MTTSRPQHYTEIWQTKYHYLFLMCQQKFVSGPHKVVAYYCSHMTVFFNPAGFRLPITLTITIFRHKLPFELRFSDTKTTQFSWKYWSEWMSGLVLFEWMTITIARVAKLCYGISILLSSRLSNRYFSIDNILSCAKILVFKYFRYGIK